MKSNIKKFMLVVLLIFLFSFKVFADPYPPGITYDTFNDHKLIYGVGGSGVQYYWVDRSASSYSAIIDQAMDGYIQLDD